MTRRYSQILTLLPLHQLKVFKNHSERYPLYQIKEVTHKNQRKKKQNKNIPPPKKKKTIKKQQTKNPISVQTKNQICKSFGGLFSDRDAKVEQSIKIQKKKKRINAAEIWLLRRIVRISWTDRVTNDNVFRWTGEKGKLLKNIRKSQISFLGHKYRNLFVWFLYVLVNN